MLILESHSGKVMTQKEKVHNDLRARYMYSQTPGCKYRTIAMRGKKADTKHVCAVCAVVKREERRSTKGQPPSHYSRGPLSASFSTSSCDILRCHLSSSTSPPTAPTFPSVSGTPACTYAVSMCRHVCPCSHIYMWRSRAVQTRAGTLPGYTHLHTQVLRLDLQQSGCRGRMEDGGVER